MEPLYQLFGRLHPMVLHLPIGLVVGLAALEMMAAVQAERPPLIARRALAWFAALSALVALGTGLVLQLEDGYGGETLFNHRLLGIGVAVAACLTAVFYSASSRAWLRRAGLLLTLGLMIPAGHFGASMTHGEGFLLAPLSQPAEGSRVPLVRDDGGNGRVAGAGHFASAIQPIFTANCVSCHGPTKQKGGLALHSAEAIDAGADGFAVIAPGDVGGSEMARRLRLALDDKDHMPPKGKPQPREADIAAIEAWIAGGAAFTDEGGGAESAGAGVAPAESAGPTEAGVVAAAREYPPAEAVRALVEKFVHVEPLARDEALLVVSFSAVASETDDASAVALLEPLREFIADLSLSRSGVGDETVKLAARMPALAKLDLRGTKVTSAGLGALRGHSALRELVLSQCALDDDAAAEIAGIAGLERVYLWRSGLTDAALEELQAAQPELVVDTGGALTTEALAAETEVKFSGDAPLPGAPVVTTAVDLKPVNSVCPVSGTPVKPEFLIVYKGRVIGFCCPNCPKEFWADPAKFEANIK